MEKEANPTLQIKIVNMMMIYDRILKEESTWIINEYALDKKYH